jgi:hypothetical protein
MSTPEDLSITSIKDTISSTLESNDAQSTQQLQTLALVHQARLAQLTRNAATVSENFGKGSPQTAAAEAAVSAARATVARVNIVNSQLATPQPAVPAGGWVLHGRVYDDRGAPVSGQTVFLVDAQSAYQRDYGFAYTDDTGYFALTAEGAPAAGDSTTTAGAPQRAPELYVEVANEKRQPVYLSSTPFQPTVGTATYVPVELAAGGKPIGDPPRAVRGSALPSTPRRKAAKSESKSKPKRSTRKQS